MLIKLSEPRVTRMHHFVTFPATAHITFANLSLFIFFFGCQDVLFQLIKKTKITLESFSLTLTHTFFNSQSSKIFCRQLFYLMSQSAEKLVFGG